MTYEERMALMNKNRADHFGGFADRAQGVPQDSFRGMPQDSAFVQLPAREPSWLESDGYTKAMEGKTFMDAYGNVTNTPSVGGGSRVVQAPPLPGTDIPLARRGGLKQAIKDSPKGKMPTPKAVQKAVAKAPVPQNYATVDPLNLFGNKNGVNPFGARGEPMTNDRFSGGVVPQQEQGAYVPKRQISQDMNKVLGMF